MLLYDRVILILREKDTKKKGLLYKSYYRPVLIVLDIDKEIYEKKIFFLILISSEQM